MLNQYEAIIDALTDEALDLVELRDEVRETARYTANGIARAALRQRVWEINQRINAINVELDRIGTITGAF